MEDLKGGDAQLNAAILRDVFAGQRGPVADALNLNAGVALASCQVGWHVISNRAVDMQVQWEGSCMHCWCVPAHLLLRVWHAAPRYQYSTEIAQALPVERMLQPLRAQ